MFLPRIPKTPLTPVLIVTEGIVDQTQKTLEGIEGIGFKGHILGPNGEEIMEFLDETTSPYKDGIEKLVNGDFSGLLDLVSPVPVDTKEKSEPEEECTNRQFPAPIGDKCTFMPFLGFGMSWLCCV